MHGFSVLFIGLLFVAHLSCSNNPSSSVPTSGTIKISIKSISGGTPASSSKVVGKATALATITSAYVVIERIRFDSSVDDTLDFRFAEPFIQDLMAGSNLYEIGTAQVPFGSYKRSIIKIDDLDSEEGTVYTQNPDLQNRSIFISGFLNNDPNLAFEFTSDLNEEQEREFNPPLILDENSPSTSIVLTIDIDAWFMDGNGTPLDPSSPSDKSIIEDNIKNSIDVFEDEDDDGEKDN